MHLLQVVVSNIFADLDDNSGSNLFLLSTDPTGATSWSPSKSSSSSNQAPQLQSSAVVSSERYGRRLMAPLCVKIAALETLELLLNVVCVKFQLCFFLGNYSHWNYILQPLTVFLPVASVNLVKIHPLTP